MGNENLTEDLIPSAEVEEFIEESAAPSEPAKQETLQTEARTFDSDEFVPSETLTWYYSLRDCTDEFFWSIIFLLILVTHWLAIPASRPMIIANHVLTAIFGIGILYYFFFLLQPFKIFQRKKNGMPDPNANSLWYDGAIFLLFIISILVFIDRLLLLLNVPENLPYPLEICEETIFALFGVFVLGNASYLLTQIFLSRVCAYYRLSPVLFSMKSGFIVTKERRIAVWDIAQVNMTRNLWQRFLGVGTVELKVHSHGMDEADESTEDPEVNARILYLKGLKDPEEVVKTINNYRLFVRRRMGRRFISTITRVPQKGADDE